MSHNHPYHPYHPHPHRNPPSSLSERLHKDSLTSDARVSEIRDAVNEAENEMVHVMPVASAIAPNATTATTTSAVNLPGQGAMSAAAFRHLQFRSLLRRGHRVSPLSVLAQFHARIGIGQKRHPMGSAKVIPAFEHSR